MVKEFSSSDAEMSVFGKLITDWVNVSYSYKEEAVKNFTGNNRPTSYSTGKEELDCSLEVYLSQVHKWEEHAFALTGKRKITALPPFPIAITYLHEESLTVKTDVVTIKVTGVERAVEGGADGLKCKLELLCLDIKIG
jgi:hypothetical protein